MNDVRRVDPSRSRIILVGVESYTDAAIPDEPAIANNITDLTEVLTDPVLGAFDPGHLLIAPAGAGVEQVGNQLIAAAEEAEDLLLFYYAGHGFPTSSRAELYLSLAGTGIDRPAFTALPFDAVRDVFLGSAARSRVVILDCCYSGKAIGRILGDADVLEPLEIAGTYTLTASPATRPASAALPGERHTAFTGRLLELLRAGNPDAGPDLSLGDIYRHLRARLRADGLPEPQQRGTATGDQLALTPNPAYSKGKPAPGRNPAYRKKVVRRSVQPVPLPKDLQVALGNQHPKIRAAAVEILAEWLDDSDLHRVRAARDELRKIAESDRPEVAEVARAALRPRPVSGTGTALTVSGRAATQTAGVLSPGMSTATDDTTDTAELLARQISVNLSRAETLAAIAKAVAAYDERRAARLVAEAVFIAGTVDDPPTRAELLVKIAAAVPPGDPDRAWSLVGEAEELALAVSDESSKGWALAAIAEALAANAPNRAEGIARRIVDSFSRVSALVKVAKVMAANDPGRASRLLAQAEAIAHESIEESAHVQALTMVATALAASDPERAARLIDEAETIAAAMVDEESKGLALAEIAQATAVSDPDRAERIAASVARPQSKAWALTMLVEELATNHPDRARAIAYSISDPQLRARALATLAGALATADPDEAETVAYTIAAESWRARALAMVAEAMIPTDPDHAARLVGDAARIGHALPASESKVWALTEIAGVRRRLGL
jgi:caspase domain-containing protein